jgi:assimilatory nitrate reductase catalytic subunit
MVALMCAEEAKDADFPLVLNTGRLRDQWHTMTRTGRVASLMRHTPIPVVAIHPAVAAAQNIVTGNLVRIETRHGAAVMRAALDETLRPGELYAAMHWTDQYTSSGPVGKLVHAAPDPLSGQPDLKGTPARLSTVPETWRGQVFRSREGVPPWSENIWWSKAQMERGFAFEAAGWSPLAETISSEEALRELLGISDRDELVQLTFPRGSVYRFAAFDGDRLLACAFFGPAGTELPEAELPRDMLGKTLSAIERLSLLSGTSGSGTPRRSRTICSCFVVSEEDIRRAIAEHGHVTVGDIGGHLRAGTNCGSCIPELKKLLAERNPVQVD